jgi:DedD protein
MDFVLKQRLVGAVVLVALAVIFIPMLLEGPDRNLVPEMAPMPEPEEQGGSQPLERFPQPGEIPDEPDRSVVQAETAAPDSGTDDEGAIPLPLPEAEAEDAEVPPEVPPPPAVEAKRTPVAAPEPEPEPDAGEAAKPAGPLGNWIVQVGSFSSEQNALRLRDRIRKERFATQVEKVVVSGKTHYRVRVGPYLERDEAEQDREKLAAKLDLKGRVLSYP